MTKNAATSPYVFSPAQGGDVRIDVGDVVHWNGGRVTLRRANGAEHLIGVGGVRDNWLRWAERWGVEFVE